jgi:hypothetical protein
MLIYLWNLHETLNELANFFRAHNVFRITDLHLNVSVTSRFMEILMQVQIEIESEVA